MFSQPGGLWASRPRLLTIKVGTGPTQARFRVSDPATFRQFLDGMFTG
jgi:hypothetical protein